MKAQAEVEKVRGELIEWTMKLDGNWPVWQAAWRVISQLQPGGDRIALAGYVRELEQVRQRDA